jgi:hypothetical protein
MPTIEKVNREDLRKVVLGWKILTGIDPNDKAWDQVHFPRVAKSAKNLLILFGLDGALDCMEYVFNHMKKNKMDFTIETIVKRSDLYREKIGGTK